MDDGGDTRRSKGISKIRPGMSKPWAPGVSGNPSGVPKHVRETRKRVSAALDAAFTGKDGRDLLIAAIVEGVGQGDSTCLRLACEYRYGKPVTELEMYISIADQLESLPDLTLARIAGKALDEAMPIVTDDDE